MRAIAGLWDVELRGGGSDGVLEEMDVARVKPKPCPGGEPLVHHATGTHPSSQQRPPTFGGRLEIGVFPGGRRPPGPDNLGRRGMGMTLGENRKRDRSAEIDRTLCHADVASDRPSIISLVNSFEIFSFEATSRCDMWTSFCRTDRSVCPTHTSSPIPRCPIRNPGGVDVVHGTVATSSCPPDSWRPPPAEGMRPRC